jgi:type II secretory pathway pseudopilin PulG
MMRFVGERGRSVFETLLVLLIVGAALLLAMERFASSARSLKEKALTMELANMRRAVIQYAMLEKKLPETLAELMKDNMEVPSPELQGAYKIKVVGKFVERPPRVTTRVVPLTRSARRTCTTRRPGASGRQRNVTPTGEIRQAMAV